MAALEEVLGRKINSIKELRKYITELQDSLINLDADSDEFKTTVQQLTVAQDTLRKTTKASTDENLAAKDSIVGMEKEFKNLYNTYKMLSEEQRNSDFGKNMAESLKTLGDKLNDTKKDVSVFKDNIGRYAGDVSQVFNTMGISVGALQKPLALASGGVKTLGKSLKSLIANPVGLTIMGIVAAFKAMEAIVKRVREAIKGNEESQMRLNQAMASFQPIIDAVSNAFDWLGQKVVQIIEFYGKYVDAVRKVTTAITDFLGITKGANDRVKEQISTYKELAKAQNELTLRKRKYQELNAKDTAEVERLREEASETQNLVEKRQLLEDAKAKQAEIDARNLEIAQEELRILQVQSGLTANSADDNEKLAAAVAKVAEAEANAAKNARQFNKQLNALGNTTSSTVRTSTKSVDEYKKKAQELYKTLVEDSKSEVQKLTEKYTEEKKLLEKYGLDTTLLTKKYESDKRTIIVKYQNEATTSTSKFYNKMMDIYIQSLTDRKKIAMETENVYHTDEMRMKRFIDAYNSIDLTKGTEGWIKAAKELTDKFNKEFSTIQVELPEDLLNVDEWVKNGVITEEEGEKIKRDLIRQFESIINSSKKIIENNTKKSLGNVIKASIEEAFNKADEASLNLNLDKLTQGASRSEFNEEYNRNLRDSLIVEEQVLRDSLVNFEGTQEQKLEIMQQYYDTVAQMRELDWQEEELQQERSQAITEAAFDSYDKLTSGINTVTSSYAAMIQAEINSGKLTEQESKKKIKTLKNLEKVQLAVNIANIAASTASGIMDVWKGYASELKLNSEAAALTGPIAPERKAWLDGKSLTAAILRTTGLAATGAANIAAATMGTISTIKGLNAQMADLGGGSVAVTATPQLIDSTPYTYTRTLQTQEEEDEMNRPIIVTVSDIEDGLNMRKVRVDESSF